jgi:hypothetical protein
MAHIAPVEARRLPPVQPVQRPAEADRARRNDAARSDASLRAEEDRRQARTGAEDPRRGANLDVLA